MDKTILEKVEFDLKGAMFSKDQILIDTLRSIKSKLVERTKEPGANANLSDEESINVMRSMVRQRSESAKIYKENNREDLAIVELKQVDIIKKYMPTEISDDELRVEILKTIGSTGVTTIKQIGTLLKAVIPILDGRAARERVSKMGRSLLEAYEKQLNAK